MKNKKICMACYREVEESMMARSSICMTCKDMLGKGDGYKSLVSEKETDEWFEGMEERKKELIKRGKLSE